MLALLSKAKVPYAIATSGMLESARPSLAMLKVDPRVPVITRDQVKRAKPDPDLFLRATERLGASIFDCIVVGDSVWDLLAARRARGLATIRLAGIHVGLILLLANVRRQKQIAERVRAELRTCRLYTEIRRKA